MSLTKSARWPSYHPREAARHPSWADLWRWAALLGVTALTLTLASAASGAPRIEFESLEHDWFDIDQGTVATHVFPFTNRGDATLKILETESSCECTVPSVPRKELAPGEKGTVEVTFDTRRFTGNVTKEITVRTNDPAKPEVTLRMYANILPGVVVEPISLDLGLVPHKGAKSQRVTLTAADRTAFRVVSARTGLPFLQARVVETPGSAGGSATSVAVEVTAQNAPPGRFTDFLQIVTTHPRRDSIQVPIKGEVESFFKLEPDRVNFGSVKANGQELALVKILFTGEGRVNFLEATSSTPALRAELVPQNGGRSADLRIRITDAAKAGRLSGTITVRTDYAGQSTLPIRVVGLVKS